MLIKLRNLKYILLSLLFANVANADGGGILLAMLNPAAFLSGNLLVILIEYLYFLKLFKNENKIDLLKAAIKINLISLFIGTILFSIIIIVMSYTGYDLYQKYHSILGAFFFALGTGIAGDNSPFGVLAVAMLPVYYFIIYFITVHIEYKLMLKYGYKTTIKQSFIWNFISYSFLAIFSLTIMLFYNVMPFAWLETFIDKISMVLSNLKNLFYLF